MTLPAEPEIRHKPAEPEIRHKPAEPEIRHKPAEPEIRHKPAEPEIRDGPAEPEIRDGPAEPENSDKPAKPGVLDRLRAKYAWLDHVIRAQERYQDSKGDFYAAGITYFTVFAIFPLLMVGFGIGGFVLVSQPDLLAEIEEKIKSTVSGDFAQQLVNLMESAIESRTSVGIIGLATAAWAGLGWMANLREALSQMWGLLRQEGPGFLRTKLSDLIAIIGLFGAIILTIALSALSSKSVMSHVLEWLGLQD